MTKDEALRLALEALKTIDEAMPFPVAKLAIKECTAALEAKDEPLAWRDAAIRLGEELSSVGPDDYYDMDAKEWLDWAMKQNPRGKYSLPQRTWVGLTDEEIEQGCKESWITEQAFQSAVWWAEAKLKEKNT
jgi:hypothetical protein